jgi:hypothetical protein
MIRSLQGYRLLRTGSMEMLYARGEIRRIMVGNVHVLQAIYGAVRDRNWGTVPFRILSEDLEEQGDGFRLSMTKEYLQHDIHFNADIRIEFRNNKLVYSYEGRALRSFLKNRIGLNVLHPVETCKGGAAEVIHPDGTRSEGAFPRAISPEQPFRNIGGMRWYPGNAVEAQLEFLGEIFEMEDQRNWTDHSFKIYGTPLELPFPEMIHEGSTISQQVILTTRQRSCSIAVAGSKPVVLSFHPAEWFPIPALGVAATSDLIPITPEEATLIARLPLRHYRADLQLYSENWSEHLERAIKEHTRLGFSLELALQVEEHQEKELNKLLDILRSVKPFISSILLFNREHLSPGALLERVIPLIRRALPGIPTGGGTNTNFAELNRNRPLHAGLLDFISFAICPQVHASDDLTLLENLPAQHEVVQEANRIFGLPVSVHALTLDQRFNAVATEHPGRPAGNPHSDPRQHSAFGASWTLGSLMELARAGTRSVTYYESCGSGGLIPRRTDPEGQREVYRLFEALPGKTGILISPLHSSHPLVAIGAMFHGPEGNILILANPHPTPVEIHIQGLQDKGPEKKILEACSLSIEEYDGMLSPPV